MTAKVKEKARGALRIWNETSSGLRKLALWFEPVGCGVAGFGVGMDIGGWQSYPFITNLASNLAGALIGIPIGLIALQRLLSRQGGLEDQRRALKFAKASGIRFNRTVQSLVKSDRQLIDSKLRPQITRVLKGRQKSPRPFPTGHPTPRT